MRRGLYRIHGVAGLPDDVRIEDDGIELPLEESLYRTRGYLPPVEQLPWREDYFSRQPSTDSANYAKGSAEKAAREDARQAFQARFRKS